MPKCDRALRRMVIADDFGLAPEQNAGVREAFRKNLIHGASLMVTTDGYAEAAAIIAADGLGERIGLHFTLTYGRPVSPQAALCPLLTGPDGSLSFQKRRHLFYTQKERRALRAELLAQIEKARAAGAAATRFDSHHHVHDEIPLMRVLAPVLSASGVTDVRFCFRSSDARGIRRVYQALYRKMFADRFRMNALFREIDPARAESEGHPNPPATPFPAADGGPVRDHEEIMTHPIIKDGRLYDGVLHEPIRP